MSVYRGVFFFYSDEESFWAERKPRGEFNPDKHVDHLRYDSCCFASNGKKELLKVVDLRNGNIYYPDPSCRIIQK